MWVVAVSGLSWAGRGFAEHFAEVGEGAVFGAKGGGDGEVAPWAGEEVVAA